MSALMLSPKPKRSTTAATKARQEEAAKARRMAKLYGNLDAAIANLNQLIESGRFFDPISKKQNRKKPPLPKSTVLIRKVGAITITSDEPFDYHRYGSFKDKIKTEGTPTAGRIQFTYTNAQGERTLRTVSLIAAYPARSPEYVVAYCELRGEERTFRLMNMENLIDTQDEVPILDIETWLVNPSANAPR